MINKIKTILAAYLLARYIKKQNYSEINFNKFLISSKKILLIFPDDDKQYNAANEVINYLLSREKFVYILIPEHKKSLFGQKSIESISFSPDDISRLGLLKKEFFQKQTNIEFDIIIDLELNDSLFCSSAANYFKSQIRVGFTKNNSDLYYNFQVPSRINSENSYRNLLNSFNMF